jgi:ABC-type Fe3+-siderophore transport system permease subunit
LKICPAFPYTNLLLPGQVSQGFLKPCFYFTDAAITLGMIFLIESGKGKNDIRKRRIMLVIGLAMFAIFFGMLLSIFKSKAQGYPYSFIMS